MNEFNGYVREVFNGYHAMLRFAEDGQAEPLLGEGGKPIVFPSEIEAQKAVTEHILRYMNGRMRRDGDVAKNVRAEAESICRKGRKIAVEYQGSKCPPR